MQPPQTFTLSDVLAVADIHPFYSEAQYPPDRNAAQDARLRAAKDNAQVTDLKRRPLLWKKDLYTQVQRLINDASQENTFRRSIYTSITGGGGSSSSGPLFFATDVHENRAHRARFGAFLHAMGLVTDDDWVVTVHTGGGLYRSLDLTLELLENAGATVLAAGGHMKTEDVINLIAQYRANVISGDSSQMVQLVNHIATLTPEAREKVRIDKIIYTSEGLAASQREHIISVLGPGTKICSILGSAEAGPYGVSCPRLIEPPPADTSYRDFVYDTRLTIFEMLPLDTPQDGPRKGEELGEPLGLGEDGIIVQTSLTRLRNPLLRYVTGDVGSLHNLPDKARGFISEDDWPHLRILRLRGRNANVSFEFDGEYVDLANVSALLANSMYRVLVWQVILHEMSNSAEAAIQLRVLRETTPAAEEALENGSGDVLEEKVGALLKVTEENRHRFSVAYLDNLDGFVRSGTGRKVSKFVNLMA